MKLDERLEKTKTPFKIDQIEKSELDEKQKK